MYLLSLSSNFSLVQRHYNKPSVLGWWKAGWVDSWLCQGVNLGSNCLNSFLQFYFVPIDPLPSEVPAASHSPAFLGFAVRTGWLLGFLHCSGLSFLESAVSVLCPFSGFQTVCSSHLPPFLSLSFFVPSLSL